VSATTDWDAESYDRLSAPQEEWARAVLERLPLAGGETVLDAGCGSGRVTRLLLDRLPRGRVIGVDGSPAMIELAREALAGDSDRLRLVNADLLELSRELIEEPAGVDAVFSNATFHWIGDQDALFARLYDALRPGGRLVAQCGGEGNVEEFEAAIDRAGGRDPFAEHVSGYRPWHFRGTAETEERLRSTGFTEIRCRLEERMVEPGDPRRFIEAMGLAAHRERLPEELRDGFTDAVMEGLPHPLRLRYVRLNIDARRPNGEADE